MIEKFKKNDLFTSFIGEKVLKKDVIEIERKIPNDIVMQYLSYFHRNEINPFFFQQWTYKTLGNCQKDLDRVVKVLVREGFIEEITKGYLWRTTNKEFYERFLEAKEKSLSEID